MKEVRILVLEDDDDMRRMLAEVLEEEGYRVVSVSCGADAVEKAASEPFDLVVADIRMEGPDGLTTLEKVQERHPDVGSLVVTGYSTEADTIRALRLGVGDYLKKPFSVQEFLQAVNRLVARRSQELQTAAQKQAVRETVLWALESVARSLDLSGAHASALGGLVAAGRLAARLARQSGLALEAAEQVHLMTLVSLVERAGGPGTCPEFLARSLPASLEGLTARLQAYLDAPAGTLPSQDQPVALRVAAAVVTGAHLPAFEGAPSAALSERWPGLFDPSILWALDAVWSTDAEEHRECPDSQACAGRRRRGLLSLARALEEGGDPGNAQRAFQDVLKDGEPSREAVEALLALGRRLEGLGRLPERDDHVRRALDVARQLGPATFGEAAVEAALLLARPDDSSALATLEEAARLLGELRLPASQARARLALCHLSGSREPGQIREPLEVLLQAEYQDELAGSVRWLIPFLLELAAEPGDPGIERALGRILRDHPRESRGLVSGGRLSGGARCVLVRTLGSIGGRGAAEVLRQLLADDLAGVRAAAQQALAAVCEVPQPPLLRIQSLGNFEVFRGEERVPEKAWVSAKIRYFLACLAANSRRPVPEDILIEEFWPGDREKGKGSVYAASSVIRRCLRPAGGARDLDSVLRTPQGLQLNPELPMWHDLDELRGALAQASQAESRGQSAQAAARLRRVFQLYRAPYLEGCYMDWAVALRANLEKEVLLALGKLGEWSGQQSRHQEALECGQRMLALDACCQQGHLLIIQAHTALGRPELAVRQFEVCCRRLRQELSMEPSLRLLQAGQRARWSLA